MTVCRAFKFSITRYENIWLRFHLLLMHEIQDSGSDKNKLCGFIIMNDNELILRNLDGIYFCCHRIHNLRYIYFILI